MQPPATVIAVPHTTTLVYAQNGCGCTVPPNVSGHVRGSRRATIATIVAHAIDLVAFGWISRGLFMPASLISFIMGGILLCQFNKCTYIVAGSLFIFGCIVDLVAMAAWIALATSDNYYYNGAAGRPALSAALCALSFIIAIVFIFLAICNWENSGAPDAMGPPIAVDAQTAMRQVVAPNHGLQMKTHAPQAQPRYVGNAQAPPPFSGNV